MRTLATLALILAASTADAKPRKVSAKAAARNHAILVCVDERTAAGAELDDAEHLCRSIARHQAKVDKLAKRAAEARAAHLDRLTKRLEWECAEEVSIACEDTTVRDHDGGECSDATLEQRHAFDACRGKAPVAEGK